MRKVVVLALIAVLNVGCTIHQLTHDGLTAPGETRSGVVTVAEKAQGLDGSKVGWGRITAFAIPVVPIYIKGDESIQMMDNIREALSLAGYEAVTGSGETTENDLTLHAVVNRARYSNYTWLIPLVPTWGGMDVSLSLTSNTGDVVWQRDFRGSGFTMNFFDGYNIASRKSMRKILNAMTVAFASEEFYSALQQTSLASSDH